MVQRRSPILRRHTDTPSHEPSVLVLDTALPVNSSEAPAISHAEASAPQPCAVTPSLASIPSLQDLFFPLVTKDQQPASAMDRATGIQASTVTNTFISCAQCGNRFAKRRFGEWTAQYCTDHCHLDAIHNRASRAVIPVGMSSAQVSSTLSSDKQGLQARAPPMDYLRIAPRPSNVEHKVTYIAPNHEPLHTERQLARTSSLRRRTTPDKPQQVMVWTSADTRTCALCAQCGDGQPNVVCVNVGLH